MANKKITAKEFLTKCPYEGGSIRYDVHTYENSRCGEGIYGDLTITDCARSVTLDVSATKKNKKRTIKKINKMIKHLERIRTFIEENL